MASPTPAADEIPTVPQFVDRITIMRRRIGRNAHDVLRPIDADTRARREEKAFRWMCKRVGQIETDDDGKFLPVEDSLYDCSRSIIRFATEHHSDFVIEAVLDRYHRFT